jgi:NAD+ kinase
MENESAADAARGLVAWLEGRGHEALILADDARTDASGRRTVERSAIETPDLAVALGGDGTILRTVHILDGADTPILGVNLGRLGFLAGAEADELSEAVEAALASALAEEHRVELQVTGRRSGEGAVAYRAINEVHFGRGPGGRAVELSVSVNGRDLMRFLGDGVIVATPTGSTAYALSVGGPIVAPTARGIVLVPVSPHTVCSRPFVLGPDDVVRVWCPNPSRGDACVIVDGEEVPCGASSDGVEVRLGPGYVRLLRLAGHDFYDVVRRGFLGG